MTNETREKVLDKIRKLLALSSSSNENEAALAAEKAQALLAEYNLSMDEVGVETHDKAEDFIVDREVVTDSLPWRRRMGTAVAAMYFCGYIFQHERMMSHTRQCGYIRNDRHMFTGAEHNVMVAKMMFKYLNDAVEREADVADKAVPARERGAFRTSFKTACAIRLCNRIYKRIEEAKAGQIKASDGRNLPALANLYDQAKQKIAEFHKQEFGKLGTGRAPATMSHAAGVAAGYAAGDKIGLDPQIRTGTKTHLIGSN